MSAFPKKIDDKIKNASVSIHFTSSIPSDAIQGMSYDVLVNELNYQRIQLNNIISAIPDLQFEQLPYFVNNTEKIRIDINENHLVFNLINEYIGWNNYKKNILLVLSSFLKRDIINDFQRISMRYISVYEKVKIFEKTKINLTFVGMNLPSAATTQIRTEFEQDGVYSIINLASVLKNENDDYYSIIDIDSIRFLNTTAVTDINFLEVELEKIHDQEVNLYFGLLKPEFILTLNPIYR